MEWDEFLKQPQVTKYQDQFEPGKYLALIVLHDSLKALNSFRDAIILAQDEGDLSKEIEYWYRRWEEAVHTWLKQLIYMSKLHYEEDDIKPLPDWKGFVMDAGVAVSEVSTMITEFELLRQSADVEELPEAVILAIYNLKDLETICLNIKNEEYLNLWNRVME